jgi:hypothetical protein
MVPIFGGGTMDLEIFIVSKQISEEALDVLYGDNFFQFGRYLISSTPREI